MQFVDTSVLLKSLAEPPQPLRERYCEASDVLQLVSGTNTRTSEFALSEFRLCLSRIFKALEQALDSKSGQLSKPAFDEALQDLFWWSLPTISRSAQLLFDFVAKRMTSRLPNDTLDWLRMLCRSFYATVDNCVSRSMPSPILFRNSALPQLPLAASFASPHCTDWNDLKRRVDAFGARNFADAVRAFNGMPEAKWLSQVEPAQQRVLDGNWPNPDEACEVAVQCAEALGDLLLFMFAPEGDTIVADDETFERLCRLPLSVGAGLNYRAWKAHDTRKDGRATPATVRVAAKDHGGELANFDDTFARIDSQHPIACCGTQVEVSALPIGQLRAATILWQTHSDGRYLHGLRLTA